MCNIDYEAKYKFCESGKANLDFHKSFGIPIRDFYDGLMSVILKQITIDIFKFDEFLHDEHGDYEDDGKSMEDIVIEKYGNNALKVLERLI